MMLMPRRNSDFDLFDDFFDDDFFPRGGRKHVNLMKTDIKEKKDSYVIEVDLPGFSKEDINLSLNNGYLEINAKVEENNDDEDKDTKYVRKERFYGECSRSFYVGEVIEESDINAEFKNGTLKVTLPKLEINDNTPEVKKIEIK